ncbi:MAG: phosphatase PAP2 family protein [Cytophagales bacterium]|nr:phosphatase PAP2 family protein [Armatimonadota bacterium]
MTILVVWSSCPASADSPRDREARFASREGNIAFLALGVLLPLLTDGSGGGRQSLRNLDALATSSLLCEGLKRITREKRPDTDEQNSFPSGHATAAFTIAEMQSRRHPEQKLLWYGGAGLIAESRVYLRRHHARDVLAGAALGIGTADAQLRQPRGFLIAPFVSPGRGGKGRTMGIQLWRSF